MKRYLLGFMLISVIISGCASKEVKSKKEVDAEKQSSVQETISVEKKGMEESESGLAQENEKETVTIEPPLPELIIATSVEEMIDLPVGRLTEDFTVEQETSMWVSKEVPSKIRPEFLEVMGRFLQNEKDPQVIHEVLITYLGSSQYGNLVEPLYTYSPTFKEPLLPEPYEVNDGGEKEEAPTNAIILLDASSSMLLPTDGRLKMDVAKSAVSSFAQTMGQKVIFHFTPMAIRVHKTIVIKNYHVQELRKYIHLGNIRRTLSKKHLIKYLQRDGHHLPGRLPQLEKIMKPQRKI